MGRVTNLDYIYPDFLAKILRKPSERTQLESSLIGVTFMILGSLGISIYMIGFTEMSIWFKVLLGLGELGILSFQWSLLVTTYIQYYTLKTALGLYPEDYKLKLRISEARRLVKELGSLINFNEQENLIEVEGGKQK